MSFYTGNWKFLIIGDDDCKKQRVLGTASLCRCLDKSTRGDAFLNLPLVKREVKDVVIISSLGCNSRGIVEFKTLSVVRKAGSRVQNLDLGLFRQQEVEILGEATLKFGGAKEDRGVPS